MAMISYQPPLKSLTIPPVSLSNPKPVLFRCSLSLPSRAAVTSVEPQPVFSSVKAFAPATVANLGPGFDFLGCAVDGLGDYVSLSVDSNVHPGEVAISVTYGVEKKPCSGHPWICENGVAPDRALDPAVIAESLSEEEIAGLREMFTAMDTDNSGAITFDELKAGLRRYGSTLKDIEIRDLMDAADIDNSGTIDYGEFIAATIHLNKLEREEHLVAAFRYFDKDGSGYITVDELQQACAEHNMTDVYLEDIIREVDQDNDGRIDYGEFVAMMQKGNAGIGRRTMRNSLNLSMRDGPGAL